MNGEHPCRSRLSDRPSSQAVSGVCRFDLENSSTTKTTGDGIDFGVIPVSQAKKLLAKNAEWSIDFTAHANRQPSRIEHSNRQQFHRPTHAVRRRSKSPTTTGV
jgi:hypothetical protein